MSDMTPDEARDDLAWARDLALNEAGGGDWEDVCETLARALATLASMRVEHDHGVVDWEQVDGRYEKFHRVRLVGEWRDADPAEAAD